MMEIRLNTFKRTFTNPKYLKKINKGIETIAVKKETSWHNKGRNEMKGNDCLLGVFFGRQS